MASRVYRLEKRHEDPVCPRHPSISILPFLEREYSSYLIRLSACSRACRPNLPHGFNNRHVKPYNCTAFLSLLTRGSHSLSVSSFFWLFNAFSSWRGIRQRPSHLMAGCPRFPSRPRQRTVVTSSSKFIESIRRMTPVNLGKNR